MTYFPIAYLTLRPLLAGIDSNVEGMALSLGASRWRVFRTVTLPLTIPGLANAFLLLFAASLADFATPLILAGNQFPVLPTQAYLQITGLYDLRGGAALSFALLVPALVVFVLQRYWVSRRFYVTITGKGAGQVPFDSISPGARWPLIGTCFAVAVVVVYLYALLVFASVVAALGANHTFTLKHYQVIFTEGRKAIFDTLIIAGIAMPLGGLYGILVGYLVARKRFPGRRSMELVSMINYALPGTIVGIAYLIAFNDEPFVLRVSPKIAISSIGPQSYPARHLVYRETNATHRWNQTNDNLRIEQSSGSGRPSNSSIARRRTSSTLLPSVALGSSKNSTRLSKARAPSLRCMSNIPSEKT
jgi:iron(III) transport system permease protein